MRVGGACFFLSAIALRAFGADAVRGCLRWFVHGGTSIAGCSDLLLCKKYALKRTTPSIAADRCRYRVRTLARLHLSSALRSNSGNRSTTGQVRRSASLAHLSNRRTTKTRFVLHASQALHKRRRDWRRNAVSSLYTIARTKPSSRTSAERGQ